MKEFKCEHCGEFVFLAYEFGKEILCEGFIREQGCYKGRLIMHCCKENEN